MKFFRYICSLIVGCALGTAMEGCSDGFDIRPDMNDLPEDYIQLNLAVPDPITVSTRGVDESAIHNLEVFIFNEEGTGFFQHQSISGDRISNYTVGLSLSNQARNNTVLIYAVANVAPAKIQDITNISDLRRKVLDENDLSGDYLPMIGFKAVNTALTNTPTISMYRSVAKVSAFCPKDNGTLKGIQLYGNSIKGYLGSPLNTEDEYAGNIFHTDVSTITPSVQDFEDTKQVYTYPSKGITNNDFNSGAYCILKVFRNDEDQYYRINLRTEIDDDLTYLDLLANHHYQIEITGFMSNGYDSAEEAAKHPENDQYVVYAIHDHAPKILSMITDGYNELGVSPEVVLSHRDDGRTGVLIVKCYAPGETVAINDISFDYDAEWLEIKPGNSHSYDSDPHPSYDKDDQHGQQFEFEIAIIEHKNVYEDQTWNVTVKWNKKALSRTVSVSYEAAFLLPQVCTAELIIKDSDNALFGNIKDYWTFITGDGSSKEKNGTGLSSDQASLTPKLYGIRPVDMTGEKKRNGGFHFPMPYGEKNDETAPWTYEYTVDFSKILDRDDTGDVIDKIEVKIEAESKTAGSSKTDDETYLSQNVEWRYNGGNTGTLTFIGNKKSYDYAVGSIVFTITYNDGAAPSEIIAGLYHTGFFHYEGNEKYVPESKKGYYYYEVVPMGNTGDYWLDRNICASSNKSFIDITDDPNIDRSAAGMHYTIIEKPQDYRLPEFDFGMCPPGYHVPNQTEWDNLRFSKEFITQSVTYDNTVFMSTYYVTGNSKIGNIYLQKARFVNGNNIYLDSSRFSVMQNNGDAGAGYYWSVTEAPAMEKEQMGNWLRALYLNGSASSYTNASVTDHRMPVRCKAGTDKEASPVHEYYVSFNVHEATHVYLFNTRDESNTPLYTFPGKAIGTKASSIKWQHFNCSTTEDPQYLRALFVKLEEDGKVTIYTRKGNSFESNVSYSPDFLSEDKSWQVTKAAYYDFCKAASERDGGNVFTGQAPSDCITSDNTGGGGGGGPVLEGDYSWTGAFGINWSSGWDQLTNVKYDWSKVKAGSTIKIKVDVWWSDAVVRFCHSNPSWEKLNGMSQALGGPDEISWNMLGQPDYNESTRKPVYYTVTLNDAMLEDIRNNGGLIITGNNYQLQGVDLKLEP